MYFNQQPLKLPFECPLCKKQYKFNGGLHGHFSKVHPNDAKPKRQINSGSPRKMTMQEKNQLFELFDISDTIISNNQDIFIHWFQEATQIIKMNEQLTEEQYKNALRELHRLTRIYPYLQNQQQANQVNIYYINAYIKYCFNVDPCESLSENLNKNLFNQLLKLIQQFSKDQQQLQKNMDYQKNNNYNNAQSDNFNQPQQTQIQKQQSIEQDSEELKNDIQHSSQNSDEQLVQNLDKLSLDILGQHKNSFDHLFESNQFDQELFEDNIFDENITNFSNHIDIDQINNQFNNSNIENEANITEEIQNLNQIGYFGQQNSQSNDGSFNSLNPQINSDLQLSNSINIQFLPVQQEDNKNTYNSNDNLQQESEQNQQLQEQQFEVLSQYDMNNASNLFDLYSPNQFNNWFDYN